MLRLSFKGTLVISIFVSSPLVLAQAGRPAFGLLHSHTSYSDGSGLPDEAFQYARDQAHCDFFAITDHNHKGAGYLSQDNYQKIRDAARRCSVPAKFVAIYGQEFSTIATGNHVNIFNADAVCEIESGDFKRLYAQWLPRHPEVPFIQFNHPDYQKDQRPGTKKSERNNDYGIANYGGDFGALVAACDSYVALIEVIVGPAQGTQTTMDHFNGDRRERDYLFYLNKGFRVGPSVSQDNHKKNWGTSTHARMGLWTASLTTEEVFKAIQGMHCYASEDDNIQVRFTANGQLMGGTVEHSPGEPVRLRVEIKDPDEANAKYMFRLFYDDAVGGGEAQTIESVSREGDGEVTFSHEPKDGGYYFVKITQGDGPCGHPDDVWTSPIWVTGKSSTDDAEKETLNWDEVDDYVGLDKVVTGRIVGSHNSGRAIFFNFHPDYQTSLSLVILAKDFPRFGGAENIERRLLNHNVKVKGKITVYQSRTQILLGDESQILSVQR